MAVYMKEHTLYSFLWKRRAVAQYIKIHFANAKDLKESLH